MFIFLNCVVSPEDDDEKIRENLIDVWFSVRRTLVKGDQELEGHLAYEKEFLNNVRRRGEQAFFDSLRAIAKGGNWASLFEDGALFSSFGSKHSDLFFFV
jgi:hypothetical protein